MSKSKRYPVGIEAISTDPATAGQRITLVNRAGGYEAAMKRLDEMERNGEDLNLAELLNLQLRPTNRIPFYAADGEDDDDEDDEDDEDDDEDEDEEDE